MGEKVTVTYSGKNEIKEVENFVSLGNILLGMGIVPGFGISDYGSVTFHFNSPSDYIYSIYSEDFFRTIAAPYIEKYNENVAEQNRIQDEKNNHRQNIHDQKLAIAIELNPEISNYTILEQIDENHLIGWISLNGSKEYPVSMQFSAVRESSWCFRSDGKSAMAWSLSLQPMQYEGNRYSGGSTSCNNCESIEQGLLEYLVTWQIYLPNSE
jgi:hypothetical protein